MPMDKIEVGDEVIREEDGTTGIVDWTNSVLLTLENNTTGYMKYEFNIVKKGGDNMPVYKIKIDCNLAGCEEEHIIAADNEEQAQEYADELAIKIFAPYGWVVGEVDEDEEEL